MNNNQMNFNPETGEQLNNNENVQNVQPIDLKPSTVQMDSSNQISQIDQNNQINAINQQNIIQPQMQSIPTIEQGKSEFINNTQAQTLNQENKNEKKSNFNYTFVIILFIIIFAAIFFLFPVLLEYI